MIGIEAALPGKSLTSANPANFAFSSQDQALAVPVLGLSFEGLAEYTFPDNPAAPGAGQTTRELFSFQHGLNYTPISLVYVFVNFSGSNATQNIKDHAYYMTPTPLTSGNFVFQSINYYVDNNKLSIYFEIDSGGGPDYVDLTGMELTLKYYIFSNLLE